MAAVAWNVMLEDVRQLMSCALVNVAVQWETNFSMCVAWLVPIAIPARLASYPHIAGQL